MKPKIPNFKKSYQALNERLGRYMTQVESIYNNICTRIANVVDITDYDGSTEFFFDDYPELKASVNNMMQDYASQMSNLIYSGTSSEWKESNVMQDLLARKVLKAYDFEKGGDKYNRYFQPNSDALKAFQDRADNGMNLSAKLWKQSSEIKKELECTISTAIEKGQSAVVLSKRLSQYLTDFPSLKADYTEKYGHAVDCRDCHYASMRLARSEINMAYRTAEYERWQQFDFILGFEVKLSKSHPAPDICDDLQGRYPKDFKYVGWHPNCMCYVVPIVMTDDEYYTAGKSERLVEDVPTRYKLWIKNNEDRIANWSTLPYFLRDNPKWNDVSGIDFHRLAEGGYEKAEKKIIKALRRQMYENIYIVDGKGNVIYNQKGNVASVYFDNETALKFKDKTLIHNHPNGGVKYNDIRAVGNSFSSDDVAEVVSCDMNSIVAVTQTYKYVMERPASGWGITATDIREKYGSIYKELRNKYRDNLTSKRKIVLQHMVMKRLSEQIGFKYSWEKK